MSFDTCTLMKSAMILDQWNLVIPSDYATDFCERLARPKLKTICNLVSRIILCYPDTMSSYIPTAKGMFPQENIRKIVEERLIHIGQCKIWVQKTISNTFIDDLLSSLESFAYLTEPNLTKVSFLQFLQNIGEKRNYNRLFTTKL